MGSMQSTRPRTRPLVDRSCHSTIGGEGKRSHKAHVNFMPWSPVCVMSDLESYISSVVMGQRIDVPGCFKGRYDNHSDPRVPPPSPS